MSWLNSNEIVLTNISYIQFMCHQIMIQICILQCVYSEKTKCVLPNVLGWFLENNWNALSKMLDNILVLDILILS